MMLRLEKKQPLSKYGRTMEGALRDVRKHWACVLSKSSEIYMSTRIRFEHSDYDEIRSDLWRQHSECEGLLPRPYMYLRSVEGFSGISDGNLNCIHIYKSSCLWWIECEMNSSCDKAYFPADVADSEWLFAHSVAESGDVEGRFFCDVAGLPFVTIDNYLADGSAGSPSQPHLKFWCYL